MKPIREMAIVEHPWKSHSSRFFRRSYYATNNLVTWEIEELNTKNFWTKLDVLDTKELESDYKIFFREKKLERILKK